ncbi:MAG: HEAT repeat domain-containing protein [Gemmatimonadaceae bacterium]|nr:HEAT repeat domain-containing protein [Gemmatimonadaceae bacterium]
MKLLSLTFAAALSVGAWYAPAAPNTSRDALDAMPAELRAPERLIPAASWAPLDTADSLWRRGRIAISEEEWERAVYHFRAISEDYPKSVYAGDALYWEAFALQRSGRQSDLRRAAEALEKQKARFPKASTYATGESSALLARVNGRLARSGDREAAVAIADIAAEISEATAASVGTALAIAADEIARARPEIDRALAEARAEMDASRGERGLARLKSLEALGSLESLGALGAGRDRDAIPEGCDTPETEERVEALNALMQMNSQQALPLLKSVLTRRDKCAVVLRRKAVFIVSQNRSEEAVDILVSVAKTDPDRATREDAVFWLSQTRSERATEVLEQILLTDAPDEEMQKKALFSLAQSRSPRAQGVLRDFVRRKDVPEDVRGDAIFWLGQSRDAENQAVLRELFGSLQDPELRDKVVFSIAQQRSPENRAFLLAVAKNRRESVEVRKNALFWAGQSGVPAKDLAEIYDSAESDVELRKQVIFVLSQRRDTAAVDKLFDIARKERDPELRKQAVFWLTQTRDPRALKLLEEIINK